MDWTRAQLGDVITLEYGRALRKDRRNANGSIPVAGSNGVDGTHSEALVVGPGIVIGRKGSAGKVTWFDGDFWPIDTTFYVQPRIKINLRWMYYLLQHLQLHHLAIVTGVPGLSRTDAYKLRVSLPAPSEQDRIAELLDQSDALRRQRTETDAKLQRILPVLFNSAFGDPITNMQTERWPLERIDKIADVSYGLSDRLDTALTADKGTRIITISNVTIDGMLDESVERYTAADDAMLRKARVIKDDLLFNWRNGSKQHIGKTAIWEENWPGDVLHVSFLLRIRPQKALVEPYYLWALINLLRSRGYFTAQSRMQINSKFNASELSALRVPVPSPELQADFARQLRSIRVIYASQAHSRRNITKLVDVLNDRAFNGRLTAQWREKHRTILEAEMHDQRLALEQTQGVKGKGRKHAPAK